MDSSTAMSHAADDGTSLSLDFEEPLDDKNFFSYALHHYDNPSCTDVDEFQEDINRFLALKKLFFKYQKRDILKERLILNHLITLINVFGVDTGNKLLFFKMEEQHYSYLKTFLVYLNSLPDNVGSINTVKIPLDNFIVSKLREMTWQAS